MKNSFLIYHDYKELFDTLNNEQAGQLIKAMIEYSVSKKIIELPIELKLIFIQIKNQIDRNEEKYNNVCQKNRENVNIRWKNRKNTTVYDRIRTDTKNTDKDKDKDKDKEYITNNTKEAKLYLEKWNESFGTGYTSVKQITKPLTEWLKEHPLEKILKAIGNIKYDPYWKKTSLEPIWLLRFKNPKGEPIDRIEKFYNTKPVIRYQTHL